MRNLRSAAAKGQKRSSSIISRIRAHQRGGAGAPHTTDAGAPHTTDLFSSVGGLDAATGNTMLSTPYFLPKPTLLT